MLPRSVSFELATQPGLALTASQDWYKSLTALGVSGLQIRQATPNDKPKIDELGPKHSRSYRVIGILSSDNVLNVPGGKFRTSDTAKLRKWLEGLGDQGAEGVTSPRTAFGLLPRQFEEVSTDLKRPVSFSTKDISAAQAVDQLGRQLKFPLVVDAAAKAALAEGDLGRRAARAVGGHGAGHHAAAGRTGVCARTPGRRRVDSITSAPAKLGMWPVGWQPSKRPNDLLPVLYEFLNVEITGIPVSDALSAIEGRLKAPFLFDRNAMALHGVDPAKVQAEVPSKRISYSQVLRRVLAQAQLKYELRVDEGESPFLWVTTIKPVR